MGLSGPRKRTKFSHDPNNTQWSRSESKIGQRILQAYGWQPGQYLGAKHAPHAKFHSTANSAHIKVSLREENLGLGARLGAAGGEWQTTGLDGFQDLLGRLNGATEEDLVKRQETRTILKKRCFAEGRWGGLRFVSGGLLVGDRIEEVKPPADHHAKSCLQSLRSQNMTSASLPTTHVSGNKDPAKLAYTADQYAAKPTTKCLAKHSTGSTEVLRQSDSDRNSKVISDAQAARSVKKAERKLAKRAQRHSQSHFERESQTTTLEESSRLGIAASANSKPVDSTCSVDAPPLDAAKPNNGRHVVRQRNIRNKRMATMDRQALNEILMIKG